MSLNRAVRNQALLAAALTRGESVVAKKGTVSSFDGTNYLAKVLLQPQNVETGWLPVVSPFGGNGWGFFAGLVNGMQVTVLLIEGSIEVGEVIGTTFSTVDRPVSVQAGELKAVHQSGSQLLFTNDGNVTLAAKGSLGITAPAGVNITASGVSTSGNLSAGTGASGSFPTSTGQTVTVRDGIVTNIY